jgi:DNA-binding NarL/FixJ family response regulator
MAVRVLIVDDHAPFRGAARTVVALTEGFEVAGEAETGEDAVNAARALAPDLVLMDVHLPGIDGDEASRRILQGAQRPVILLLSTHDPLEYGPLAAECGAAAYLAKEEFGPDTLASAWAQAQISRQHGAASEAG